MKQILLQQYQSVKLIQNNIEIKVTTAQILAVNPSQIKEVKTRKPKNVQEPQGSFPNQRSKSKLRKFASISRSKKDASNQRRKVATKEKIGNRILNIENAFVIRNLTQGILRGTNTNLCLPSIFSNNIIHLKSRPHGLLHCF